MIAVLTSWVTRKAWPYLVAAAGLAFLVFQVKRNGKLQTKLDQSERTVHKIEGMRDAVANTPTTAILFLSACARDVFNAGCPTLYTYTAEEQLMAADELDDLPEGSILVRMIGDYGVVRQEIRVCRGQG